MENNLLIWKVFEHFFFLQRLKIFACGFFLHFILCFFFATEAAGNWLKPLVKKLQCEQEDFLQLLSLLLVEPRSSFSTKSNTDSLALKPCPLSLLLLSPSFFVPLFHPQLLFSPLRDVLPFTLKLPQAIVAARTSADLEHIGKQGSG